MFTVAEEQEGFPLSRQRIGIVDRAGGLPYLVAENGANPVWRPGGSFFHTIAGTREEEAPAPSVGFVADVSVPDGTVFSPEASFVKTWRLRNTGNTTWPADFQLVFVEGERMEAPNSIPIGVPVAPGEDVEISVNMRAPARDGTYRAYWQVADSTGTPLGKRIWVQIQVVSEEFGAPEMLVESPAAVPDISGIWYSNTDDTYRISQMGSYFTWTVDGLRERGEGTILGEEVYVAWRDMAETGSASGYVVVLPSNHATLIEWDNGIIFFRTDE